MDTGPLYGPCAEALTLPGCPRTDVDYPAPLPGIVIFVHGVNSNGEWFDDAERGLCAGLNTRMQRNDNQVFRVEGSGQLRPASYQGELTDDGFIRRDVKAFNFIKEAGYSPVIRFRWGYKAADDEVSSVGGAILLDEANAWGGGPFANGCSALPDMFGNGVDTGLFLGLGVQHMNASDRMIYSCPGRYYQAFAAWRLAKLVARVREMHRGLFDGKDCPVTLVCHSQGNMIGIGSAFFGANHPDLGGLGVADTYVLANAPYSVRGNRMDNASQFQWSVFKGRVRQEARFETLKTFFDIVRQFQPEARHASDDEVNQLAWNFAPQNGDAPRKTADDRKDHDTRGHVFLYCNPHDRVISVTTVEGMGWLGLSQDDVKRTGADGLLYQRVWAQTKPGEPFKVGADYGSGNSYDYWTQTIGTSSENGQFWEPPSDRASLQIREIWRDERKSVPGQVLATGAGLLFQLILTVDRSMGGNLSDTSASPDQHWAVPLNAPKVPCGGIEPKARYLARGNGQLREGETYSSEDSPWILGPFNRHKESASDSLNPNRADAGSDDPYASHRSSGRGDAATEAAMRYDQNAGVRQEARRVLYDEHGKANSGVPFTENDVRKMNADHYREIRGTDFGEFEQATRMGLLAKGVDQQATNHSTILTNPAHGEHVLAYDVDVGICHFNDEHMNQLRRMADWRWCQPDKTAGNQMDKEFEYYSEATFDGNKLAEHARFSEAMGALTPLKINGERNALPFQASNGAGNNGAQIA
ncbi:hypothetical protein LMG23992_03975 [Cupriavidus laharis]|uniref:DUF3274 domain-containing protein n=1 Tax=Cupriavidus laharis TaxID=151654 RepID=A0ABN7Z007_9BURK|nr:DUF3274 domain-containing protein [Cupriavidus laharis]CAG9179323.1 hypothetical protein LMG23992_03975 [Cupriavidus laharis]